MFSFLFLIIKARTECSRTLDSLTYGILGFSSTTEIRDCSVIETVNLSKGNLSKGNTCFFHKDDFVLACWHCFPALTFQSGVCDLPGLSLKIPAHSEMRCLVYGKSAIKSSSKNVVMGFFIFA